VAPVVRVEVDVGMQAGLVQVVGVDVQLAGQRQVPRVEDLDVCEMVSPTVTCVDAACDARIHIP
jgi:hypothetical protein